MRHPGFGLRPVIEVGEALADQERDVYNLFLFCPDKDLLHISSRAEGLGRNEMCSLQEPRIEEAGVVPDLLPRLTGESLDLLV
ncbi:hypothetical protein DSECCO2_413280 [anaerobic digester metagenome]